MLETPITASVEGIAFALVQVYDIALFPVPGSHTFTEGFLCQVPGHRPAAFPFFILWRALQIISSVTGGLDPPPVQPQ
jgi:hypothetical protein